ncbi:MAG: hypothetical protein DMG76_23660 [Acidobacteria bacterium]|nr:MAG: hypothetical protein DMG76_23660 [Acidobacteriota bacterium]
MNACIEFSPQRGELLKALFAVQGEIEPVKKTSSNDFHKSKYADLSTVFDAALPALRKHEILLIQGANIEQAAVSIETLLLHLPSGEWVRNLLSLVPAQLAPQPVGGAITYGRRYSIQSLLAIAPEDDDGNVASGIVSTTKKDLNKLPPAWKPFEKVKAAVKAAAVESEPTEPPENGMLEGVLENVTQTTDDSGTVWTSGYLEGKRLYTRNAELGKEMLRHNDCDCEISAKHGKKPNYFELLSIR